MTKWQIEGELRNGEGELLDFRFHGCEGDSDALVLIGHGVTANKDREWAITLSETLARSGVSSLRFSFAGNGQSEGAFEASCPTKETRDAEAVLDFVCAQNRQHKGRILFAGHSMGAAVGVLLAARDKRLAGLISLAGMVHTAEFAQRKFGAQHAGASFMWDLPLCPLSQAFLDDMETVGSVLSLGREIQVPWLLVHGTADTVVPIQESKEIAQQAPNSAFEAIPEADHIFSTTADEMARIVCDWIQLQS
jgi:uncharacterized protein